MKYALDFLKKGGNWLGTLRERFQIMFINGNGETIYWGSDQKVQPNPTMKQIEELGAYAVSGYHDEIVEPMLEQLRDYREILRNIKQTNHFNNTECSITDIDLKINRLSMMIDNKPEWILKNQEEIRRKAEENIPTKINIENNLK